MMLVPFLVFWVTLFLARQELGIKGVLIAIVVWAALFACFYFSRIPPVYFAAAQTLLDIILIIMIFGGDITIR
jgi:hypothetical protein